MTGLTRNFLIGDHSPSSAEIKKRLALREGQTHRDTIEIMRYTPSALVILLSLCASSVPQSLEPDDQLMAKARAAYDAPFTRNLESFDCSVQFDWKQHYAEMFGSFPASAAPMVEKLQAVNHRVNVDHTQAVVSSIPKQPDFSAAPHRPQLEQLEQVFIAMVSSGLNAWIPSSTNVVLPVGKTQYKFEKLPSGYKLTMKGENVAGTLLLEPDLRVTSGVMQLPQPMRFSTNFDAGPQGFTLSSVKTGQTTDTAAGGDAAFAYTYQFVDGIQIPDVVTITPATTGKWRYRLTDCKVIKFVKVQVLPPS
ncbi:MAG: hypothetical protein WA802_04585 [Terracidiphilus sp.]